MDHHLDVALRELALEEVRGERFPQYPSRMACLYVSQSLPEAEDWAKFFVRIGRPTYSIVRLEIEGNCFVGDATKCFDGCPDKGENLRRAALYWENDPAYLPEGRPVAEMLVDGKITVAEILQEINANLPG